jgi:hypothetical protein
VTSITWSLVACDAVLRCAVSRPSIHVGAVDLVAGGAEVLADRADVGTAADAVLHEPGGLRLVGIGSRAGVDAQLGLERGADRSGLGEADQALGEDRGLRPGRQPDSQPPWMCGQSRCPSRRSPVLPTMSARIIAVTAVLRSRIWPGRQACCGCGTRQPGGRSRGCVPEGRLTTAAGHLQAPTFSRWAIGALTAMRPRRSSVRVTPASSNLSCQVRVTFGDRCRFRRVNRCRQRTRRRGRTAAPGWCPAPHDRPLPAI